MVQEPKDLKAGLRSTSVREFAQGLGDLNWLTGSSLVGILYASLVGRCASERIMDE